MAKLIFRLRNVPEEEAAEVRALLDELGVDWYETRPGPFGLSAGGLWLRDAGDFPRARARLDAYQARVRERVRAEREAALREGRAETFATQLHARPVAVLASLLAMLLVLGLTLALPWLLLR